ncbi:MAG: HAD family phosphatase [Clostridia bacterium]|nr:HAD family phosphatase [Clostridia bacterium]
MKNKLAMFDMDGTLFDTRAVNYNAYKKALQLVGGDVEYDFFLSNCYGKHYKDFVPYFTSEVEKVHDLKKDLYSCYLYTAVENTHLFSIMRSLREKDYYTALVTTASKKNVMDLLSCFGRENEFDLIVTQENVSKNKPDPEAYLYAMEHFSIAPENSIIFEDSKTGIAAAEASGAYLYIVKGFA